MLRRAVLLVSLGAVAIAGLLLPGGLARAEVKLSLADSVTLTDCDARVRDHPEELESYLCYWIAARKTGEWREAAARLETIREREPENDMAGFYLGWIRAYRFLPGALPLIEEAAEGFAQSGELRGETFARLSLARIYRYRGRVEEAERQMEIGVRLAESSGDTELKAQSQIARAWAAYRRPDPFLAWSIYRQLDMDLSPDGPAWLRYQVLRGLGATARSLGNLRESLNHYRRAAELHQQVGNLYVEAIERCFIAELAWELVATGDASPEEARELTHQALEISLRGEHRAAEALVRQLRARDTALDLDIRLAEVREAVRLEREVDDKEDLCQALRLQAAVMVEKEPGDLQAAQALLDETIELGRTSGRLDQISEGYLARARIGRTERPREEVIADYMAAIDAIERMRDLQWDELTRGRFLWRWAPAYYRLAGFVLDPPDRRPSPEEMNQAFATVERLRARTLLDALDAADATDAVSTTDTAARTERQEVLQRIAGVQSSLLNPELSQEGRSAALRELERLELEESRARERLVRSDPSFAMLWKPAIPDLAHLQAALATDQAMISFSLSTRKIDQRKRFWNGGSWAFLITRDAVQVFPVPDSDELADRVAVYLGLLERRDDSEREASARLYRDLLADTMEALPADVSRLIVIPDGALHRLPFGALRQHADAGPLAVAYEISLVPSATLWAHWKTTDAPVARPAVLSFADPELAPCTGKQVFLEGGSRDWDVPALPQARAEARALVSSVRGASRLLTGDEASERFLKSADLAPYGTLHFAAHAVVDDKRPQRSAVLLSPGAEEEDGLLQLREIVALDLEGRLVILSACRSASGELTSGEGVVGLARGFFQAGARTVVGSLWPLRDAETAEIVTDLAFHLGRGASVGAALAAARRDWIRSGAPSAAWAGLVVLGDGDSVPAPGERTASSGGRSARTLVPAPLGLILLALAGLVVVGLILWLGRSK